MLLNYSRYAGKDFCVWYDSLRPTHPTIHEEISKVLFHTAKFSYKSKCNLEAKSFFSIYLRFDFLGWKMYSQVYVVIMYLKFIFEAPLLSPFITTRHLTFMSAAVKRGPNR